MDTVPALYRYLDRIAYGGSLDVSRATLAALMAAHVAAIPFENIDVQLGRTVGAGIDDIHAKLVGDRRGGWCYEQNGLFGWALAAIGFDVRRISAGVMRDVNGDGTMGNHLALICYIDGPLLVDVGFGGSLMRPIALAPGGSLHLPYAVALSQPQPGWWRFSETIDGGAPFNFDFREHIADEALMEQKRLWQRSDPQSVFVQNLVIQQRRGEAHIALRGRVLTRHDSSGQTRTLIESADALIYAARSQFGLDVPELASIWDRICARHDMLFAADQDAGKPVLNA